MRFGKFIMALVADCGLRRNLGTGKSLSFVGPHRRLYGCASLHKFLHEFKGECSVSIYNNQWIPMSHIGSPAYSYVRLQDIYRVVIRRDGPGEGTPFSVIAYANGTEFLYTGQKKSNGEAENAALELLRLIETAFGRLPVAS